LATRESEGEREGEGERGAVCVRVRFLQHTVSACAGLTEKKAFSIFRIYYYCSGDRRQ
jgi:hypothetical protein